MFPGMSTTAGMSKAGRPLTWVGLVLGRPNFAAWADPDCREAEGGNPRVVVAERVQGQQGSAGVASPERSNDETAHSHPAVAASLLDIVATGLEELISRFRLKAQMVLGPKADIPAILAHVGVEGDVDRGLGRIGRLVANAPEASDPASIEVGKKGAVVSDKRRTFFCFDRQEIALAIEGPSDERGNDRFCAYQIASPPGATRVAQKAIVRGEVAVRKGSKVIEPAHAPNPPATWRRMETSSKTVASSTTSPPRRR
jgi:hypothetical protein